MIRDEYGDEYRERRDDADAQRLGRLGCSNGTGAGG